ncbi:hypothetical protein B0H19DRAFT_1150771, partial [Mycena capillaripes]
SRPGRTSLTRSSFGLLNPSVQPQTSLTLRIPGIFNRPHLCGNYPNIILRGLAILESQTAELLSRASAASPTSCPIQENACRAVVVY